MSAAQVPAGNITLNYKNVSALDLLKEIDRQTPYTFVYDPAQMSGARLATVVYRNTPVRAVLDDLERKSNLRFTIINSNVSVRLNEQPPARKVDPGKLSGRVIDEKGQTFPSAGIRVLETKQGMQTTVDGTYTLSLPPGTYTIEVSYVSYETQRITGVQIKSGAVTRLDISMKPANNALKEVVVTSGFQRASAAGLYARQKNAAGITDGISALQIARTPDNNVGAVLKRISGLNVVDNRYVVVRGLGDRYNQAQIDGVTQPSTEMNQRNFAFDAIPAEMVSSVVVNKTATPDQSSEFGGGQVNVITLDIPVQNFTQIQLGTGFNSNTINKDFLQMGKRGGAEFFGFMDNRHQLPSGLRSWQNDHGANLPPFVTAQSRAFDPDGFKLYRYRFQPNQNYRFTFGRAYKLKNDLNFGFVGGATLRNTQEIHNFFGTRIGFQPNMIDSVNVRQNGTIYRYSSAISGLLNVGLQGKTFKLSLRNIYTHNFRNDYFTDERQNVNDVEAKNLRNRQRSNFQSPESTAVLQSRLEGEHSLFSGATKFNWNTSYTNVEQQIDDRRREITFAAGKIGDRYIYGWHNITGFFENEPNADYRLFTDTRQKDYNWGTSLSHTFNFLQDKTMAKIGYNGFNKQRSLTNSTVEVFTNGRGNLVSGPYEYALGPDQVGTGPGQIFYNVPASYGEQFSGKANSNSAFAMLDQSFFKKLRLVYGLRYEVYKLSNTQFKTRDQDVNRDDNRNYLPSFNVTYSVSDKFNIRGSYSKTVVRPDFRETSVFGIYDPILDARIEGSNVVSTLIENTDVRLEWYPAPGEIISLSGFYKDFDKPIELVFLQDAAIDRYGFQNQRSATNYGLEMEVRKSLGFIADKGWLKNLSVFGNGTLIRSRVVALEYSGVNNADVRELAVKRALFGQAPWIVNAGLAYTKDAYGINVVYNKSGYRTNTINYNPNEIEYEMGRNLVDVQVFTRLFKQRGELKLNIANLLNAKSVFYKNLAGYTGGASGTEFEAVPDKSNKYDRSEGDFITYKLTTGTNVSMAFTYRL